MSRHPPNRSGSRFQTSTPRDHAGTIQSNVLGDKLDCTSDSFSGLYVVRFAHYELSSSRKILEDPVSLESDAFNG